ncbi:MAG: hypothetical protein Q4G68_09585 [Planctomycetia bacterium]|nr:hypothetical protein [Planctomycetia bacterium]
MKKNVLKPVLCSFLLSLGLLTGCQPGAYVSGKVEFPDGKPLTLGTVCFQGDQVLARGDIMKDGSYKIKLTEDRSKIPYGLYRVSISGAVEIEQLPLTVGFEKPVLPKEKALIDQRFMSPASSGLQCEVGPGMTLPFNITVDYPKD